MSGFIEVALNLGVKFQSVYFDSQTDAEEDLLRSLPLSSPRRDLWIHLSKSSFIYFTRIGPLHRILPTTQPQ